MELGSKVVCPFRRKENGDFECCYGNKCMAYYEWTSYKFGSLNSSCKAEEVINVGCKLFTFNGNVTYPAACSPTQGIKDTVLC